MQEGEGCRKGRDSGRGGMQEGEGCRKGRVAVHSKDVTTLHT